MNLINIFLCIFYLFFGTICSEIAIFIIKTKDDFSFPYPLNSFPIMLASGLFGYFLAIMLLINQ